MRKTLIGILIIVIVLALLPFGFGIMAKHQYQTLIAQLSKQQRLQISLISYHRGWLASTAQLKVSVQLPNAQFNVANPQAEHLSFVLDQKILHGPVIFASGYPHFGSALIFTSIEQNNITANTQTFIHYNGAVTATTSHGEVNVSDPSQHFQLTMDGIESHLDINPQFSQLKGEVKIANIAFDNQHIQQQTKNFTASFDLKRDQNQIWLGQRKIQLASLSIQKEKNPVMTLQQVNLSSQSQTANGKINGDLSLQFGNMTIARQSFDHVAFQAHISDLDAKAYAQFIDQLQQLKQSTASNQVAFKGLAQSFMQLFATGLKIEIQKLAVATPWGNSSMQFALSTQPFAMTATNVLGLLNHLNLDANLSLSQTLAVHILDQMLDLQQQQPSQPATPQTQQITVKQTAQQKLASLVQSGQLIQDGDQYKMNIHFQNMQLSVNGKTLQFLPVAKQLMPSN